MGIFGKSSSSPVKTVPPGTKAQLLSEAEVEMAVQLQQQAGYNIVFDDHKRQACGGFFRVLEHDTTDNTLDGGVERIGRARVAVAPRSARGPRRRRGRKPSSAPAGTGSGAPRRDFAPRRDLASRRDPAATTRRLKLDAPGADGPGLWFPRSACILEAEPTVDESWKATPEKKAVPAAEWTSFRLGLCAMALERTPPAVRRCKNHL